MDTQLETHKKPFTVHPCYFFLTSTYLQIKGSTFTFRPATTSEKGKERKVDQTSSLFLQCHPDSHPANLFEAVVSFPVTCDSSLVNLELFGTFHCLLFYILFFTCCCLASPCPSDLASHRGINNLLLMPKPTQAAQSCCWGLTAEWTCFAIPPLCSRKTGFQFRHSHLQRL